MAERRAWLAIAIVAGTTAACAVLPSPRDAARVELQCRTVAGELGDSWPARITGVSAVATDAAGLRRASRAAISFQHREGDPDKWPGLDDSARAAVCFLDGEFEGSFTDDGLPIQRVVVGFVADADAPAGWVVIDYGPIARVPVVAP